MTNFFQTLKPDLRIERAGKNNRNKTEREKKFLGGKQERERMRMEQTAERESPEAENFQLFDAQ